MYCIIIVVNLTIFVTIIKISKGECFMTFGYINTNYIIFLVEYDEESIKEKVEEISIALQSEFYLKQYGYINEEDDWSF